MHSTVRISSFRWTFAGHCRLIFYSIFTSKVSFKRSLFYLNIDVCFKKFVSKWDSYGHSKLGKSKGAVTSPYQLSGEVLGYRGNVAKLNAVVYSSTEQVLDRSTSTVDGRCMISMVGESTAFKMIAAHHRPFRKMATGLAHGATFRSRGADSERSHLICVQYVSVIEWPDIMIYRVLW